MFAGICKWLIRKDNKKFPYSKLEHVKGKPFVIALAPFDNHLSYTQNNTLINQVLYGVLPPTMENFNDTSSKKITHITKQNGNKIDLGIFTNDSYKEISAIIFSTTGTFGKAISQSKISNTKIRSTRLGPFRILCQLGKIENTKGHKYENRNRCRAIC